MTENKSPFEDLKFVAAKNKGFKFESENKSTEYSFRKATKEEQDIIKAQVFQYSQLESDSKHAVLRYNEGKPVKNKTKIILFAGAIGSGKNYQLNKKIMELKETGNSILMLSFADPIKQIVKDLFGFDKNGKKTDNRVLSAPNYNDIVDAVLRLLARYDVPMLRNLEPMTITIFEKYVSDIRVSTADRDKIKSALRGIMQIIGTEIGQTIKKEMWPMIAVNTIKTVLAAHRVDYVFIDDLRFLFEYLCVYREFQHDCDVEPFF
ncbi:MAG: hypothetical protein WCW63_04085, partial [Acholeplasmataceae bacterium]